VFLLPQDQENINTDQGDKKNGCNKVAIELHAVQFWSEILLVISN